MEKISFITWLCIVLVLVLVLVLAHCITVLSDNNWIGISSLLLAPGIPHYTSTAISSRYWPNWYVQIITSWNQLQDCCYLLLGWYLICCWYLLVRICSGISICWISVILGLLRKNCYRNSLHSEFIL